MAHQHILHIRAGTFMLIGMHNEVLFLGMQHILKSERDLVKLLVAIIQDAAHIAPPVAIGIGIDGLYRIVCEYD
jgi:hypothetical protein